MLSGLKEGKYILEEFSVPVGYNSLAEDIYFEINKLSEDEANLNYYGFYKSFVELQTEGEDPTINDTGYIKLDILNYRGLTLPSTGGMGTLLFTLIGIGMMLMVIGVLCIRRRDSASYM